MLDGSKLRKAREAAGLTQEQAATRAGLSGKVVWYQIESGRRQPSMATLVDIAKALKVKPAQLLK